MSGIVKSARYNLRKPKITSSNITFCPTNSPKPKYIQLTIKDKLAKFHI